MTEAALGVFFKRKAMSYLQPRRASGPQCADGKDNDRDGLVDAGYDSGCTNARDGTEGSALTCKLGLTQNGLDAAINGTCSGPFGGVDLSAPLDTSVTPTAEFAVGCGYVSESKLECLMKDGPANPRHLVRVRLRLKSVSLSGLRVLVKDLAGRGRAQTLTASPPISVDPATARCAARFDFGTSRLTVRCDGADVKSSSAATGGPVVSDVRPADSVSAALSRRCEARPVSGSGVTAARCLWNAGNRGKLLSFQFAHDRALGAVTIHVLAGGSGEEGTTIVLRQTWRPLEGFLCQQSIPQAESCATP
ncbi:MAG: hypothetical protein WD249_00290 [Gaiellaceae bacterium]